MKLRLLGTCNEDKYNRISFAKSDLFLEQLQGFLEKIGIVEPGDGAYTFKQKSYALDVYRFLFQETDRTFGAEDIRETERHNDVTVIRIPIQDFDNSVKRFHNDSIDINILFFEDRTTLIFYCDPQKRSEVIAALEEFCDF